MDLKTIEITTRTNFSDAELSKHGLYSYIFILKKVYLYGKVYWWAKNPTYTAAGLKDLPHSLIKVRLLVKITKARLDTSVPWLC